MPSNAIYTVSDLTRSIRQRLETSFPFVWVKGQVVNLSCPSSGHIYFSLKDENASINAVWFKKSQEKKELFDPLTGEVYENGPKKSLAEKLKNGQEIICAGRLSVYEQRGLYQIIVELAQEAGLGILHLEFERLRKKLDGLGYFSQERKRPLPKNPKKVALISAKSGAVIHDFFRIAQTRGLGAEIRLYPSLMQGKKAHENIIKQINRINSEGWAEVLVIIRGGGSLEDLQAFNNEDLATAIVKSRLPVLAGIGHEVDFTLADLSADLRAATPSHAAQLLWIDKREYAESLSNILKRLKKASSKNLMQEEARLQLFTRIIAAHSPYQKVISYSKELNTHKLRLNKSIENIFFREQKRLDYLEKKMSLVPFNIGRKSAEAEYLFSKLKSAGEKFISHSSHSLEKLKLTLKAYDPLKTLERGYAAVHTAENILLKNSSQVKIGDSLRISLATGEIHATVTKKN